MTVAVEPNQVRVTGLERQIRPDDHISVIKTRNRGDPGVDHRHVNPDTSDALGPQIGGANPLRDLEQRYRASQVNPIIHNHRGAGIDGLAGSDLTLAGVLVCRFGVSNTRGDDKTASH
ncbi:MAG: hypothetical protein ACR2QK_20315 [Acidimicrobiales bacterium]